MCGQEGHIFLAGELTGPSSYSPVKHVSLHDTWSATTRVEWYHGLKDMELFRNEVTAKGGKGLSTRCLKYKQVKAQIETSQFHNQIERFDMEDEQDKHLINHIAGMISLFILACGIPALIRIAELVGSQSIIIFLIALAMYLGYSMIWKIEKKVRSKRLAERNVGI